MKPVYRNEAEKPDHFDEEPSGLWGWLYWIVAIFC